MHLRSVLRLTVLIQLLVLVFMLIPTIMALCMGEKDAFKAFTFTILVTAMGCLLVLLFTKEGKINIRARDSYLLVTLSWILITATGALPLYLTGTIPTYLSCYFEIMSGLTTTGATVLVTIEDKLKSILFWRNMTNWLGGMGIVVLFVAVLPFLGVKGTGLVNAESVGPTKDKLTPKIQQTAFVLWAIYIGLSVIETLLLLVRLPLYDAVTVTFGTMGAAGFATTNASIGSYDSAYVDIVVTIFMMAAGMNFALFFKLLNGQVRQVAKDSELRCYLSIITVISLLIAINLVRNGVYTAFSTALRYSAFQVVSIITTTGFATADYVLWPTFAQALLLLLFFIGGCSGSAGGGIKVIRVQTMLALTKTTIRKKLHPAAVTPVEIGGATMQVDTLLSIAGFVGAYLITGLIGTAIFSFSGYDIETCFTTSFQLLGNIGIGMGKAGPSGNLSIFNDLILTAGSFLMLVGRLELFTVYSLFTKAFWRK